MSAMLSKSESFTEKTEYQIKQKERELKAAEGYYLHGMNLEKIAADLHVSKATVSRLVKNAVKKGYVTIKVAPRNVVDHKKELEVLLPKKVREICVTPLQDMQGNSASLAVLVADLITEKLILSDKNRIGITIGCGKTLLHSINEIVKKIRSSSELQEELRGKTIDLYPMVLSIGNKHNSEKPHNLVAKLADALEEYCTVNAYTPVLPHEYTNYSAVDKNMYLMTNGISHIVENSKHADIFICSAGYAELEYQALLKEMTINEGNIPQDSIEINYIPHDKSCVPLGPLKDIFVGITSSELRELSLRKDKTVMLAVGGIKKLSLADVIFDANNIFYNTVCTDISFVERYLNNIKTAMYDDIPVSVSNQTSVIANI